MRWKLAVRKMTGVVENTVSSTLSCVSTIAAPLWLWLVVGPTMAAKLQCVWVGDLRESSVFKSLSVFGSLFSFVASSRISVAWSLVSLLCSCLYFPISASFYCLRVAFSHIRAKLRLIANQTFPKSFLQSELASYMKCNVFNEKLAVIFFSKSNRINQIWTECELFGAKKEKCIIALKYCNNPI